MRTRQSPPGRVLKDYLYNKASRLKIPLNGTFELTPICNFACGMCYVRKSQDEVIQSERPILQLEDWRRIAKEAKAAGMLYLLLTGGEPLLWTDFWTLYDELSDMGFLISINTNGSLINQKAIERFKSKPPHCINITLYGANDNTYKRMCGVDNVFERVDYAIKELMNIGVSVKLNCSITPQNESDLDRIIDYASEKELVLALTTYMFPPVRRSKEFANGNVRLEPEVAARYLMHYLRRDRGEESYFRQINRIREGCIDPPGLNESCIDPLDGKVRCRAGKASFWISWDGWMTPCGMMLEPQVDVVGQPFEQAWKNLNSLTTNLKLSGVCDKCQNNSICHPCAAISYSETGEYSGIPKYLCRMTQEMRRIADEENVTHNS